MPVSRCGHILYEEMRMKILFVSLGCDKNLVDSEVMLGLLSGKGYSFTEEEEEADIAIVNTCCFINDAKEESINTLLELALLKKTGRLKALIAAGCLAQRYEHEITEQLPEVDAVVGTAAADEIVQAVEEVLAGRTHGSHMAPLNGALTGNRRRVVTTGGHYAYLKIAEGCEKRCTYCIIPKIRGNYRSVPMEQLEAEAAELADGGVKELILVAQETTLYGRDLYGEKKLPELLKRLCRTPGLQWIRILYCYPEEITQELIETIRSEEKICHYLDLPIQHGSDDILRRMGRRTDSGQIREIVKTLRERIPDICIRTTLLTGFPGETRKDHEKLMDFVREMRFDRLGVFAYSPEEGTPAAEMPGQVGEKTKEKRRAELMELQQELAFAAAKDMEGRTLTVLIEGKLADEDVYVARTYKDAPNVDGYLFLKTGRQLMSGDFVRVRVTGAREYDLTGEICDEFTE